MTILDSILSIIEPGYHAPDADRPIFEPRVIPAHRICACGADEVREGRTICYECIMKTAGGARDRERHRLEQRRAAAAKRARAVREARAARLASPLVGAGECTCGRPARAGATCGRRRCR
jgi:hypothetical protein